MLEFFCRLRDQGKLVLLCLHPSEPVHLDILGEVCERYLFMHKSEQRVSELLFAGTPGERVQQPTVDTYLGKLAHTVGAGSAPAHAAAN